MTADPKALKDLAQACGLAGCTEKQIRAVVLEATGHTQEQIAAELDVQVPAVSRLLERAHRQLEGAARVTGSDVARLIAGWVYDDDRCLSGHPMTIAAQVRRRKKGVDKGSKPVLE